MYAFQYRAPRFPTDFPVDLVMGNLTLRGRCNNINGAGMQAEFASDAGVGGVGMVSLSALQPGPALVQSLVRNFGPVINRPRLEAPRDPEFVLEIYARITYFASRQTGLAFIFRTEHERAQLIRFVESVSARLVGQGERRVGAAR